MRPEHDFRLTPVLTVSVIVCAMVPILRSFAIGQEVPAPAQQVITRLEAAYPDPRSETGVWRAVFRVRSQIEGGAPHEVFLGNVLERHPGFARTHTFQLSGVDSLLDAAEEIAKVSLNSFDEREQIHVKIRAGTSLISYVRWSKDPGDGRISVWEDCPSKNHDWDVAMSSEELGAPFRGFFAEQREPLAVLLKQANRVRAEPLSADEHHRFAGKYAFELPGTVIRVWTNTGAAGFPTRLQVQRSHDADFQGEPVWKYLRRGLSDSEDRSIPFDALDRNARCDSYFEVTRMSGEGAEARVREYTARFETTDRNGARQIYETDAILVDHSPAVDPAELTDLLRKLPNGIEVVYQKRDKEDGLYREWRDGKPVVVERPKVQETIEEAVQQAPVGTRAPEAGRAQLYLLLGACALLVAMAAGLGWYHLRSR